LSNSKILDALQLLGKNSFGQSFCWNSNWLRWHWLWVKVSTVKRQFQSADKKNEKILTFC